MKASTREKIGVGLIGTGMLARSQHLPNLLAMPDVRLSALCDSHPPALAAAAQIAPGVPLHDSFKAVAEDPATDVIVLATTERLRLPVIELAAKNGKPVYCEKPLAADLPEALTILRVVRESGVPFCVGHNRRCAPAMIEARELFASHMRHPAPCAWRYRREEGVDLSPEDGKAAVFIRINDDWQSWKGIHLQGESRRHGLLVLENTHFADIACWFLGAKPLSVTTVGTGPAVHSVVIRFEGGHLATIASCANGTFGYPKELYEAVGRGGIVVVDGLLEVRTAGIAGAPGRKVYPVLADKHPHLGRMGGIQGWLEKKAAACRQAEAAGDPLLQFTAEPDKGHAHMLGEFLREVRGEREPVSSIEDAVRALRICVASVISEKEGRTVHLSELD